MAKKIAVTNKKGGCGKTTTAVNIIGELAVRYPNKKFLLVDNDSQGSASSNIGCYDKSGISVADVLLGNMEVSEVIKKASFPGINLDNIYVLPANKKLKQAEEIIKQRPVRNDLILKKALSSIEKDFDYIIIDCNPDIGTLTINALTFADYVLVPMSIDKNSFEGYDDLTSTVKAIKEDSNPGLKILGVFLTKYEGNVALDRTTFEKANKIFKDNFFKTVIRKNVDIREAPLRCVPVNLYNPDSNGAKDYKSLVSEMVDRLERGQ